MKFNYLFIILLFLLGTIQMQGQKDCAKLIKIEQLCEKDGSVTLLFHLVNNSTSDVRYLTIEDGNGWFEDHNFIPPLPPQGITSFQINYPNATQGSEVCFTIRLFNPKKELCCYTKVCIDVDVCPCASIVKSKILCDTIPDSYLYCFKIFNPASSLNTIDRIVVFSGTTPDLCVNGSPVTTTVLIAPIPPGTVGTVCLTLTGCTAPLQLGQGVGMQFFLEDSNDLDFCCQDFDKVTIPCCATGDCSDLTFFTDYTFPVNGDNDWTTTIVSGITGVVDYIFWAATMPDSLRVTVNGFQEDVLVPGSHPCNGAPPILTGKITVKPCDVVVFEVVGNSCNLVNGTSGWTLETICNGNFHEPNSDEPAESKGLQSPNNSIQTAQNGLEALVVYPNPAKDVLNIRNNNSEINCELVRVIDGAGRTVISDNMSGKQTLQIDTKSLVPGTYLLELIDANGDRIVEKFVKL